MSTLDLAKFELIAFDFDGTLADSRVAHTRARIDTFDRMAELTGDDRYRRIPDDIHKEAPIHGTHSAEIIGWILETVGISACADEEAAEPIIEIQNQFYWAEAQTNGLPAIHGAVGAARKLADRQSHQLGIVTTGFWEREVRPFLRR